MADETPSLQDKFTGLTGIWKQVAGFGIAGFVCWLSYHFVTVTLPAQQQSFHAELQKERDDNNKNLREEREKAADRARKAREHAKEVTKELSDSIRGLTRAMDSHQSEIRDNQWRQIELQKQAMKQGQP